MPEERMDVDPPTPPPLPSFTSVKLEDSFCFLHCQKCILRNCSSKECIIVKCPLRCGSQMHKCKLKDHMENICPYAEATCINASFGCPRKMRRQFLGHHLLKCSASIVHCSAEWNRMPRFLGEKRPFILPPTCTCCNNSSVLANRLSHPHFPSNHFCLLIYHTEKFDQALTARDQAVLEDGSRVSDKTKGALRCGLTKLYPALPMTSPLYNGLFLALDEGIKFPSISPPHAVIPALPSGLPNFNISDDRTFDVALTDFNRNRFLSFNENVNDNNAIGINGTTKSYSAVMSPTESPDGEADKPGTTSVAHVMRLSSSCPLTEKMSWAISDRSLQVDCQMAFFPRYVQKPPAMYTFLCDQDIPRHAYARHSLLHSEAVVQVDYWLEQRCPLAYLGCPFSVVRLRPNTSTACLAYMPTVNAFTVRYTTASTGTSAASPIVNSTSSNGPPLCHLERLPLEILKRILSMLDEVSLMSLWRVSPRLAEVCRSVLPTRGIVAPLWQRRGSRESGWHISGFMWSLPSCGEPVRRWFITDSPAPPGTQLTRHLNSECAFYDTLRAQKPFCLYNSAEEKPPFLSDFSRQPEFI